MAGYAGYVMTDPNKPSDCFKLIGFQRHIDLIFGYLFHYHISVGHH